MYSIVEDKRGKEKGGAEKERIMKRKSYDEEEEEECEKKNKSRSGVK